MRHKYDTRGLVLARTHTGEANTLVTLLTPDLGLVRARAQGLRRPGAKLAAALTTFAESRVILVRGKESWRVAGAVLEENWFSRLPSASARTRAARVSHLLLRLVAGESHEAELFPLLARFFDALATQPEAVHEEIEILVALNILSTLGLDAGDMPTASELFSTEALKEVGENRGRYIARINAGISASEL